MLVEPVAAHGRGGNQPDRLVVLPKYLVRFPISPRCGAQRIRPGVSVTLAFDADKHGSRMVLMRFGVAAGLVLSNEGIEAIGRHSRFDAAIARGAAVVERQIA